jgi:hypothetical protein
MHARWIALLAVVFAAYGQAPPPPATEEQAARLDGLMRNSPPLGVTLSPIPVGRTTDYVSSVAAAPDGVMYVLHRNLKEDPVIVLGRDGRILRSWGKGLYTIPHSVRVDPAGNVWTVDAGASVILKFTQEGKQLLRIDVGEMPERQSGFRGTADITFGPGGRLFVADGYGNARVLEYSADGRRVRQWGTPGTNPGQFHLPHGIAAAQGSLYVADRENGRIQRFDLEGRYLGAWDHLGKTFSITEGANNDLWIGTQPRNVPNGAKGWLVRVDRATGKVLGQVESPGFHSVHVTLQGELLTGARSHADVVVRFRP